MYLTKIKAKILHSKLAKDSIWSVFGNGVGSAIMLLAGIIIARFLGSDVYGEYGVVKSTMLYIASFSSFGLSITSTKYVAEYSAKNPSLLSSIIKACYQITLTVSITIALVLIVLAPEVALWLNEPTLVSPLRYLGIIIICRSVNMTQIGILGGLKEYKVSAKNYVVSSVFMFAASVPLTYYFQLAGALLSLLLSQAFNCGLNYYSIANLKKGQPIQIHRSYFKEIFVFSFPVAIQESTYFIGQWGSLLILTKYTDMTQVGLYSAASQWSAIILFIPGILYNVVISHLSSNLSNKRGQADVMRKMLIVNCVTTTIPCVAVWIFSGLIINMYGVSFSGLKPVLVVLSFSTIFVCCANVFRSKFVAYGKNWLLLLFRAIKDIILLLSSYLLVKNNAPISGAYYFAWAHFVTNILFFMMLLVCMRYIDKNAMPSQCVPE